MTALAERKVAAVIGALVADAAAQPLHWNYKTDKLDAMLEGKEEVAFWEPSANPFYRIKTGKLSCYGDQSYVILKSLVDCNGLDMRDLNKRTFEMFGPDSDYEDKTNAVYKDKSDAEKKTYPIDAPWRNASIKNFIKQYQAGNEETGMKDEQMDGVLRLVSVVALYAGRPEMLEKVEAVVTSTQNSDTSLAVGLSAARILEYYILNGQCTDGVDQAINQLSDPKRNNPTDLDKAMAGKLRQVLGEKDTKHIDYALIPGAFQSAVHGVVTNTEYTTGVRTTIRAGGCNCSRGGFIGACLAAQYGVESIPEAWKEKTLLYTEISDLAKKLYKEILQLTGEEQNQSRHAFNIYIDLCEVRQWWNVKIHYNASLCAVYLSGHPSRHEPRQVVLPLHCEDMVTPKKLQEFLMQIKVDTNSSNGITLAVTDADSTLVYYKISDGLTVPEDPDMADTKKHARWLRFRHRQSHAQRAINHYTEAKSVGLNNDDTKLEGGEFVSANVQHEGEEDDLVTLDEEEDEFGDEL